MKRSFTISFFAATLLLLFGVGSASAQVGNRYTGLLCERVSSNENAPSGMVVKTHWGTIGNGGIHFPGPRGELPGGA